MEITEEVLDLINSAERCEKCGTNRCFAVMGYEGLYCKCTAEMLAKTPQAKEMQMAIKSIMLVKPNKKKPKICELYGLPVIFSENIPENHKELK